MGRSVLIRQLKCTIRRGSSDGLIKLYAFDTESPGFVCNVRICTRPGDHITDRSTATHTGPV